MDSTDQMAHQAPHTPSTTIHKDLLAIMHPFKGILLDAYGVFWAGNKMGLIPGAKQAMATLVAEGKVVGILSNSTQLKSQEVDKLARHGLKQGEHYHFLLTSGEIARQMLENDALEIDTPRRSFYLFGSEHPRFQAYQALFSDTDYKEVSDITQADFIYVSTPHIDGEDQTDPELFRPHITALIDKAVPLLCVNPDKFACEGNPPRSVVRQGSIAQIYEEMGGSVHYIGKPYAPSYAAAMTLFNALGILSSSDILMVGDTPETDILGANRALLASALITQTGIMNERIQRQGLHTSLNALLPEETPRFFIEVLGKHF